MVRLTHFWLRPLLAATEEVYTSGTLFEKKYYDYLKYEFKFCKKLDELRGVTRDLTSTAGNDAGRNNLFF